MNWPALIVLVIGLLIGAAWGSARGHRDAVRWIEHFVSADAGQRSAIRDLYVAEGYEPPDFYAEAEPEPRESWWRRLGAWMRGTKGEVVATVEDERPVVEDEFDDDEEDTDCPECAVNGYMHRPTCSRAPSPDPLPQTDPHGLPPQPGPKTQPDLKQAAKVAPLPTFEEWQQEFTARVERDLAEIRGVK